MKPVVAVTGVMNTKGTELHFISEQIKKQGCDTLVIELSLGKQVNEDWIDIPLSEVLKETGAKPEEIFAMTRGAASKIVTEAGKKLFTRLQKEGKIQGIIAFCGGVGSAMVSPIMQAMPFGFPKLLLSTVLRNAMQYIGSKDISLMYPVSESGLNGVTKRILSTAAGSIAGGAKMYSEYVPDADKPLVAVTMQGVTTPCAQSVVNHVDNWGQELGMIIHATGAGGMALEDMIREGYFKGVIDVTLGEMMGNMLGGVCDCGPNRLEAACECGVPQVLAPGSLDFGVFRNAEAIPEYKRNECADGIPGRAIYFHNTNSTVLCATLDETFEMGRIIGTKLSNAKEKTSMCIPMRGFSGYDMEGTNIDWGWAGPQKAPSWIPSEEHHGWSKRAEVFIKGLLDTLDRSNTNIDLYQVDMHINDPCFAELLAGLMDKMLHGGWVVGCEDNGTTILQVK